MNFTIAIPSYKRPTLIVQKSLNLLLNANINFKNVYVFIVQEDEDSYKESLKSYNGINIAIGPVGLHNMRNFIHDFFQEGTCVLQMDDDIESLLTLQIDNNIEDVNRSNRYTLHPIINFQQWINDAFELLKNNNLTLFGVYPVKNGFFMKDLPEITFDLRFCVGSFWGYIVTKDIPKLLLEEKEDFERTLLHYTRDKGVIRFNHVTIKTRYYNTPGGMQSRHFDRQEASKESCKVLCERFPKLCRLYLGKKNGMHEVRLKDTN